MDYSAPEIWTSVYLGKMSSACQPNPKFIPHVMDLFVSRVFPKVITSDSVTAL